MTLYVQSYYTTSISLDSHNDDIGQSYNPIIIAQDSQNDDILYCYYLWTLADTGQNFADRHNLMTLDKH